MWAALEQDHPLPLERLGLCRPWRTEATEGAGGGSTRGSVERKWAGHIADVDVVDADVDVGHVDVAVDVVDVAVDV